MKSVCDAQPQPEAVVTYLAPSLRRLTSLQAWTIGRSSRGLDRDAPAYSCLAELTILMTAVQVFVSDRIAKVYGE